MVRNDFRVAVTGAEPAGKRQPVIRGKLPRVRRSRWLAVAVTLTGCLAAVVSGAPAAHAYATCNLDFYYNNDGSAAWPSAHVTSDVACFSPPAIARTGSGTKIAADTADNALLLVYANQDGSPSWTSNDSLGSIPGFFGGQAMAQYTGGIVLASSAGGGIDFFSEADGTRLQAGQGQTVTSSGIASLAPSVTRTSTASEIAATGTDGSLWFYWNTDGSSYWGPERVAGAGAVSGSPVIGTDGGGTEIAATGPNGNVWFFWIINGTTTWHAVPITGAGAAAGSPALVDAYGVSELAFTAPDGSLWFFWIVNGTPNWQGYRIAGPGAAAGSPAMVVTSGSSEIAARRSDGSLWFYWAANGTRNWSSEQVAGPGSTDSSPVMTRYNGGTEIAVAGT